MSFVKRWQFLDTDTNQRAIVQINPKEMSTPTAPRSMSFSQGTRYGSSRIRGFQTPPGAPNSWTFGGVVLSKEHYDMLLEWSRKDSVLRVTEHLGRTFEIIIESLEMIERLPTATKEWRADFTMNCLLLGEI